MRRLWPLLTYGWGRRRLRDFSLEFIQLESTGFIRNRVPSPSEDPSRVKSQLNDSRLCMTAEDKQEMFVVKDAMNGRAT
jgi:hypothetical protein